MSDLSTLPQQLKQLVTEYRELLGLRARVAKLSGKAPPGRKKHDRRKKRRKKSK